MIKVKDGYAKLIGTTYQGSATQVLLSNGGDLEYSASSKASTLVQRNASQHIYATYFNSAISDEALTDIGSVYVRNTSDTFIRRVSKTQFYSILDDKFVTLDTTQSITGAKTFSTSVRFANNASIIQNQNDTSNYTTILKWYKNGASRNTYDPSIGQHNTGGDGNGSICILPYPTATSPWGGTVGLFISKGVLKLDGKSVALAENYYTKTESDERYVNVTGDTMTGPLIVKAAITGTQLISTIATGTSPLKVTSTTVVTNLNSDLLDGLHETSFFRARGSQSIASSIPTTTELSTNNNLCGSWNVSYTGASGHLVQFNTGSGSTRYMQFYSMYSGSLYWRNSTDSTLNTKSWKTIVDSANYTGIVLKIGTATKGSATLPIYLNAGTPTACSTTLGVSITGNAATATKLQTARTINGTSFDGTANIVTAYWGTARTISLSGAVTGSASVNGSQNVTITTTYQFGSIDGRYVGGNKTANHGSSGTAYTADTYSSTFVNKAFVAFAERGSWAYANNGYVSTDTGVNIPLAGTAIFQWGASDTNKTQLYITPHNNSGVSNPAANEMLFYTSNGSGYTSAWTRVLTHRNYTNYTVTKTGGGASGTWGISITGNAATATTAQYLASNSRMDYGWNGLNYFNINGTAGTAVKANNTPTTAWWHILRFNHANSSGYYTDLAVPFNANSLYYKRVAAGALVNGKWVRILDELNYTSYVNPANFVTALGTNGNYVTWTKNGTVNNLTVPFATSSNILNNLGNKTAISGTTLGDSGLRLYRVYSNGYPTTYGNLLNIGGAGYGELLLGWTGDSNPGHLYYRSKRDVASQAWSSWVTVLDSGNYTGTLDARYVTLATTQTISGVKTFTTQQKFTVATGTSPFTVSSTTVVSNLNADMLDGYHRSNLYSGIDAWIGAVGLTKTISVTGSSSTWYPVVISVSSSKRMPTRISIHKNLGSTTPAISGNHSNGTSSMWLIYEMRYTGWDGNGGFCRTLYRSMPYASLCAHTRTNTQNSGSLIVWLRGGTCSYDISCTNSFTVNIYYSTTNISGISGYTDNVAPMTSTDNLGLYNTHHRYYVQASSVVGTLTFAAGAFAAKTYNGSAAVTVNIPTHTSHLTNNSGFWTGARYWANIAVSTASSTGTSPTFSSVYLGSRLYLNNKGSNSIYCGPNDAANTIGGALNNLVFSSWYGVSFTTSCAGQTCTDKNAVSINCRTGQLNAYQVYANGFHHRSMDSNSYVLLAGGSYKALTDFAKGNAGSATKGVYVTGGTVTAMTYSLSANLNSGTAGKLATYSSGTTVAAYNSTVGASNRGIYMSSGVPTTMTYSLNSTVNSGTSGKLAYYSSATIVASYSTTLGNAWTPVYMNAGVPTTCSYSFCGGYSQPIVLLAGTIYRSSNSSNYWYFTGTKHFAISGMNSSISINGGVACFTFNASSGRSFTIYGAIANHQASTKMTSYTSGESGNIRSDGLYWFGTYTSSHNVYIRACCNADSNNDSTQTRPGAWQTWSGAVTRLSIVLIGYAY